MEVRCDKCQARYRVDDARIGPLGLTMRCGKCQNTFKVMRASDGAPAKAMPPAPARPPDEGAGRTMMFQTAPIPPPAAARAAAAPPPPPPPRPSTPRAAAEPSGGSTMPFAQAPSRPPVREEPSRSTLVFDSSAPPAQRASGTPRTPMMTTQPDAARPPMAMAEAPTEMSPPLADDGLATTGDAAAEVQTPEPPVAEAGAFDRAPPKALIVGMAATVLVLLLAVVSLLVWKKTARRPPPAAAIEAVASARSDADKDTLASLASAESKARDAIDTAGPRARFPEGVATLVDINVQWADALSDQAASIRDEAKAGALQDAAKAKLRAALEAISPALKTDPKSSDVQLAFADYHRAQKAPTSMNKAIRNSGLKRDDPRVQAVQGMALLQDEDSAEKAIPKLKAALAGAPESARLHFRLAQAYAAAKDEGNARAELTQTLRISPQHERAKALLQQLGPAVETR